MYKKLPIFIIAGILLLGFYSCSGSGVKDGAVRKLNRKSAVRLIDSYPYFNKYARTSLLREGAYAKWDGYEERMLEKEGVITIETLESDNQRKCISLTRKGKKLSQDWRVGEALLPVSGSYFGLSYTRPTPCGEEAYWEIPVGSPEVIEVTGIKQYSDTEAEIEFTYKYVPNKMGKLLTSSNEDDIINDDYWEERNSVVEVSRYDDGWRIATLGYGFDFD